MVLVLAIAGTIAVTILWTIAIVTMPGLAIGTLAIGIGTAIGTTTTTVVTIAVATLTTGTASRILATRVARHPGGWMSRQPVCNSVSVCLVVPADVIVYLICTRNLGVLGTTIAVRTFVVRPPVPWLSLVTFVGVNMLMFACRDQHVSHLRPCMNPAAGVVRRQTGAEEHRQCSVYFADRATAARTAETEKKGPCVDAGACAYPCLL